MIENAEGTFPAMSVPSTMWLNTATKQAAHCSLVRISLIPKFPSASCIFIVVMRGRGTCSEGRKSADVMLREKTSACLSGLKTMSKMGRAHAYSGAPCLSSSAASASRSFVSCSSTETMWASPSSEGAAAGEAGAGWAEAGADAAGWAAAGADAAAAAAGVAASWAEAGADAAAAAAGVAAG